MRYLTAGVLVASLLLCIGLGQSRGDQPWSVLPNVTGDICPGTCLWPGEVSSSQYCCKGCSCDEDCFLEDNCCFEELYKKDLRPKLQQCTIAATRNLDTNLAFEMIDRNPANGCIITMDDMNKNTQCGKVDVAEWGSLYPVISRHTGKIYRNELCALCHNDTSYVTWTTTQVCQKKGRGTHFFANALDFASISKYHSDNCYYGFQIYGFDDILYQKQCFISTINHCTNPSTFSIPVELNLTRTEVVNACISGFMSPVANYANIFCWMCGTQRTPYCSLPNNNRFLNGFIILFDPVKFGVFKEGKKGLHYERQACFRGKDTLKETCTPLFCPTGQIWLAGRCDFVAKQWRQGTYYIQMKIKLIEEGTNDNSSMAKILDFFYQNNVSTIESSTLLPLEKDWGIASILYHPLFENDSSSGYIVFELRWENDIFEPNIILKELKNYLLTGNGELDIGEQRLRFSYEIDNIPIYQRTYPDQSNRRISPNVVKKTDVRGNGRMPLYITKLFFCEQIELNRDEFNLSSRQDLLYYKATQVYLYLFEFSVFDIQGNITARICASDSPYSTDLSSGAIPFSCDILLTLFAVTLLCFQLPKH